MIEALRAVIKRLHYPLEVMITCVRWYVAYPLSLRYIEEMIAERGVFVDPATSHRRALKIVPALVKLFRGRTRPVGKSWRMDETNIKVAANGSICTVPSTAMATRWASCLRLTETWQRRTVFLNARSIGTVNPRRSRSTGAAPTLPPSTATTPSTQSTSTCGNANTSTTSSNRTIAPSSVSSGRCWSSSPCVARKNPVGGH